MNVEVSIREAEQLMRHERITELTLLLVGHVFAQLDDLIGPPDEITQALFMRLGEEISKFRKHIDERGKRGDGSADASTN